MEYSEWEKTVPSGIRDDTLWKMRAYRLALYLSDESWPDVTRLCEDPRTRDDADQLHRAVGSIGANLAEGYSRPTGRDRARFYEYSLGSARESRDWYYKVRHVLGADVTTLRLSQCVEIIRLLLTMIPQQRGDVLRDAVAEYGFPGSGEDIASSAS
ncbi:MAG: four helix bundle protein [Planctomycetes bacterium]|nr:four helix bundle protein [Planctomycetota bacterium]